MKKKIALIFGVSGQDGAYLADFLIKKNYLVVGITRKHTDSNLFRLKILGIKKKIKIHTNKNVGFIFLEKIFQKYKIINEIYFLSGESSPKKSLEIPLQTFNSNTINLLKLLEFLKKTKKKSKLFYASSSEIFKKNKKNIFNEKSELGPISPYGISKVAGTLLIKNYREHFNLFLCSGILFNHESPLRSKNFVFKKIILELKKIKKNGGILKLGNINIKRDIGWAPEYVKAMWKMLQLKKPIDIVIGSGSMFSIKYFLDIITKELKINKKYILLNNQNLLRKLEINAYKSDPKLAKKKLRWKTNLSIKEMAKKLLKDELF
jgi:GDPmannose 4,6-dehydratase